MGLMHGPVLLGVLTFVALVLFVALALAVTSKRGSEAQTEMYERWRRGEE